MGKNYYFNAGDRVTIMADHKTSIDRVLPVATYTAGFNPVAGQFFLELTRDMKVPSKLYGNTLEKGEKLYNTFKRRDVSTGVLLSGLKGTGKTLLSKHISCLAREDSTPTILVNACYDDFVGFMKFIQSIDTPSVIIFDEFEKVYDTEEQNEILTLLDGVMSIKHLYIFTCNDEYRITDHIHNRPSRVYYSLSYGSLGSGFIKEYCEDELEDKSFLDSILDVFQVFGEINFDMVQILVSEVNVHKLSAYELIDDLNINPTNQNQTSYNVMSLTHNGITLNTDTTRWTGNIFSTRRIRIYYDEIPQTKNIKPTKNSTSSGAIPIISSDDDDDDSSTLFDINDLVSVKSSGGDIIFTNSDGFTLTLEKDDTEARLNAMWKAL